MKRIDFICYILAMMLTSESSLLAQEPTNAFNDLLRKGGSYIESSQQMRIAVTPSEMEKILETTPKCGYLCFTEDRLNDISRTDSLPKLWAKRDRKQRTIFKGMASPNEFYSFQVGVYSNNKTLKSPKFTFSALKGKKSRKIEASAISCFNLSGTDSNGKEFEKDLTLEAKKITPLWIGIELPEDAEGIYKGTATLSFENAPSQDIKIEIDIKGDKIINKGYNEGWRKSRLNWLNSNIGRDKEVTAPYIPIEVQNNKTTYLGGEIKWNDMGLPQQITSYYNANNALSEERTPILTTKGMSFCIETEAGIEQLKTADFRLLENDKTEAVYRSVSENSRFRVECTTTFSFDGFSFFDIKVKALSRVKVKDIRLEVPYTSYAAKYMMGINRRGGLRKDAKINWTWDVTKHQDKVWMGNVNAGLNFCFMDEEYKRALVNIYYKLGSLNLPSSWGNNCRGGISIEEQNNEVLMTAYSGAREMLPEQELHYNFKMLITPVRPQNFALQSEERFFHSNSDLSSEYLDAALKAGANNINVHHKKDIYPFINYPYYDESVGDLKQFIDKAHAKNVKVRAYYTTRELTVKVPEFWALRSLGGEIFHDGPGRDTRTLIHSKGPHKWLNENLGTNFIPAWYNAFNEGKYKGDMDLSVITTPDSRWNNYYLEGLDWMVKEIGLDGVYIDDSALDRITLQRARRILDKNGERKLIDIHSWNHFNQYAGFANSIHIYLELLPYVDRIWIGEGFPASTPPDQWLIEMSGIPFGLTAEALDAHNIYRGMVYGMLPRLPWSGNPVPMWKLLDNFGMKDALISGYWSDGCPISHSNEKLKTTVYKLDGRAMVVVGNWSDEDQKVTLNIDEELLGFKINSIRLPEIDNNIQKAKNLNDLTNLSIPAQKGVFIILE